MAKKPAELRHLSKPGGNAGPQSWCGRRANLVDGSWGLDGKKFAYGSLDRVTCGDCRARWTADHEARLSLDSRYRRQHDCLQRLAALGISAHLTGACISIHIDELERLLDLL